MKAHTLKLFLLISIVILVACETQPLKPEQLATEDETSLITEPTIISQRDILIEQAEKSVERAQDSDTIEEQLKYRALAASRFIEAGRINLAKQQLDIMTQAYASIKPDAAISVQTAQASISLTSAEIAIAEKNVALVNQILSTIKPVTREQQIKFYALKADLDFLSGKYMFVIDRRVQLESYIISEEKRNRNNRKIWAALSSLPTPQLNKQHSDNPTIKGWLDLAKVMRSSQQNISKLEDDLLDWGTRYPLHPVGDVFLSELISSYQQRSDKKQIAVLLPMQGSLSTITATIKNGLLSAYYLHSNTVDTGTNAGVVRPPSPIKPVIKFYDSSNKSLSFQQLYQHAIDEGASHIIGPLDKAVINQLAQQTELEIPVLTLNYSEHSDSLFNSSQHDSNMYGSVPTTNLFQFGLSPIDEAQQVAELAIRQNKLTAAVFYPDSEWGRRLTNAFTEHYAFLGGAVLAKSDYATNTNDYSRPIRALLNLDQSTIRRRKVENTISEKTQSEPRRRQDVDMIFLVATHHSARGIMPAFKFHHAGDLPVYATSHVYTGKVNRDLDSDLNALIFCDLPWILQNNSALANVFAQNWPQQQPLTRLFALGIDAYHLVYNLDYLQNKDYAFYDGQTGNIQLDENNRITRKLLWAKFINGRAVYFKPDITEHAIAEHANSGDRP